MREGKNAESEKLTPKITQTKPPAGAFEKALTRSEQVYQHYHHLNDQQIKEVLFNDFDDEAEKA